MHQRHELILLREAMLFLKVYKHAVGQQLLPVGRTVRSAHPILCLVDSRWMGGWVLMTRESADWVGELDMCLQGLGAERQAGATDTGVDPVRWEMAAGSRR